MTDPHGADSAEIERLVQQARDTLAGHPHGKDVEHDLALLWLANRAEIHAKAVIALAALRTPPDDAPFQQRVALWMAQCFGPVISGDKIERGDRLLEEVFELLQSGGYERDRVLALVEYVWGRAIGEPMQEVGGVMVTLAAYCLAFGLDMHDAGEVELARIFQPEIVERIRAKQAAKASTIPFSPLPVAPPDDAVKLREALERIADDSGKWMDGYDDLKRIARAALKGTPNDDY